MHISKISYIFVSLINKNNMKTYTEQDLRESFKAGIEYGKFVNSNNYFNDSPLTEDEYIKSINEPIEENEETLPITYGLLKSYLSWNTICDLTGLDYYCRNEGYTIEDNEIFQVSKIKLKEFKII